MIRIAPSILAANFVRLEEEIRKIENYVKLLHIDVMDGHFVDNLTFGPPIIHSIRKITNLELDVHLMVSNPETIIEDIITAGADNITLHFESTDTSTLFSLIKTIHEAGKSVGISLRPKTQSSVIEEFLPHIDRVLCMAVEPGYGGQSFQMEMLEKIQNLKDLIQRNNPKVELEVDGGINTDTAPLVVKAGATILVAGSAIFGKPDPVQEIKNILNLIKKNKE